MKKLITAVAVCSLFLFTHDLHAQATAPQEAVRTPKPQPSITPTMQQNAPTTVKNEQRRQKQQKSAGDQQQPATQGTPSTKKVTKKLQDKK